MKKGSLALIGQVPMVPTYHDLEAGNSGDGDVACIVTLLGWDDTGAQVRVSQLFTFLARFQDHGSQPVDLTHHSRRGRRPGEGDFLENDCRDRGDEYARTALLEELLGWLAQRAGLVAKRHSPNAGFNIYGPRITTIADQRIGSASLLGR